MTMRDCPDGAMRDLLPLYVSGKLVSTEQTRVASHVATCMDCATEAELLRTVARAFPVPMLDVASICAKLPTPRVVPIHRQPLWRVAASLALFIAGTATVLAVIGRQPDAAQVGLFQSVGTQTGAAPETTLAVAISTGGSPAANGALLSLGEELSDLTDAQLELLLGSLDGLDPRPQADPMTIATPIIQDRTQAPSSKNQ